MSSHPSSDSRLPAVGAAFRRPDERGASGYTRTSDDVAGFDPPEEVDAGSSRPDAHDAGVRSALALVAESSFFACALPVDDRGFEQWVADNGPVPWVRVAVSFSGTFDGAIDIDLPEMLGSRLLSAFAGMADEEGTPDAQVRDMMGEFANMVCGSWLTQSCRGGRFDLTPPSVQYHKAGPPPAARRFVAATVLAAIDDVPLRVTLTIPARQDSAA